MSLSRLLLPAPGRAFPTGWHDRLIKAAIHPDEAVAFAHADAWLQANDIDHAAPRDHRLLVEITARFGSRLAGHAAYPRLVGLRRMLWTRSRMALREAEPALLALGDTGVEMLLLKGGARLANAGEPQGEKVAHDLDIAVRRRQMPAAFDTLLKHGWRPAHSTSHQHVREHLPSLRGVRMSRTHVGDINLHAGLFQPGQGEADDDAALWKRSRPALLDGVDVRLACPEDGLALSIAHGGFDAHDHGDWLVDVADTLSRPVDWPAFEAIIAARSLHARALFALSYLSHEARLPVPPAVLDAIFAAARARPLLYIVGFAGARADYSTTIAGKAIRAVTRSLRKRAFRRKVWRAPDRWLEARRIANGDCDGSPVLEQAVAVPPALSKGGLAHFHAVLQLEVPPIRRRIEFEVDGGERHMSRIRYRRWGKSGNLLTLAIDGPVDIAPGETSLMLVSRPGRLSRPGSGPKHKARYDALPFRCVALEITGEPAGLG